MDTRSTTPDPSAYLRLALVLCMLTAIGPFAIDMYLPTMPTIGFNFGAQIGDVQLSLIGFFVGIAVSQLVYGPAADMLGRKLPMYVGLGIFVLGSVGCAVSGSASALVMCRFLQGLGGGAAMVVPRAVVRDLYTGDDATRLIGLLMLVFSVSPMLSPMMGSVVSDHIGWRGIFWVVAGIGLVGMALVATALDETRPRGQRTHNRLRSAYRGYKLLLRDRYFVGVVLIGSFGMAAFFIYLANSSFVLIQHHGLSPRSYSLAFGVNALAFFAAAQCAGWLSQRLGMRLLVKLAVFGFAATMVGMLALYLNGNDSLALMLVMLFVGFGFLGFVVPTTSVLALENHGFIAGTASALMGTLQLVIGAAVMAVVGAFIDGTPLPMLVGITVSACLALIAARLTLGGLRNNTGRRNRNALDPTDIPTEAAEPTQPVEYSELSDEVTRTNDQAATGAA